MNKRARKKQRSKDNAVLDALIHSSNLLSELGTRNLIPIDLFEQFSTVLVISDNVIKKAIK